MKKFSLYTLIAFSAILFISSCKPKSTLQKDIKYMSVRFKPLSRGEVTLVGNLETQITVTGKMSKQGKLLDKSFMANYKKGLYRPTSTEFMYFAPGPNEVISGSLYDNDIFNSIYGTAGINTRKGLFGGLLGFLSRAKPVVSDPGLDFAYFALIEKYPDVDYFINVRFDRKCIVTTAGKFTETVIVKSDGIKLKTD